MIEVFKTNIQAAQQAGHVIALLLDHFPGTKINVDLHDCDKVLRIEGRHFFPAAIMVLVKNYGFTCSLLE